MAFVRTFVPCPTPAYVSATWVSISRMTRTSMVRTRPMPSAPSLRDQRCYAPDGCEGFARPQSYRTLSSPSPSSGPFSAGSIAITLLRRGAGGGLGGGSPGIPDLVLRGGLFGVQPYVALRFAGQVAPSPHLGLARSTVLEDHHGSRDQKADRSNRERDDVAHQKAARRRQPRTHKMAKSLPDARVFGSTAM